MNVNLKLLSAGAIFFLGLSTIEAQKKDTATKTSQIDEVVVVAYGKQSKETVVGSNVEIKAENFAQRSITNLTQALDGASPGVQITTANGQPGSALSVRIRGFSSINTTNNPLYVVDGSVFLSGISTLNPDDIESINILKDAASTSLYGSSAANGVVMITTKKGKKGRDQLNLSASTGVSMRSIPEYDRLNAAQYYPIIWESLRNGQLYATSNPSTLAVANAYASENLMNILQNNIYNVANNELVVDGILNPNAKQLYSEDLDWQRYFFKKGLRQNYDINYSGGNDRTSYFASFGYLKEDAYVVKSNYERINARLSVDSQIKKWLKLGTNISISNASSSYGGDTGTASDPFSATRFMGPIYGVYRHDPITGAYLLDENGNRIYAIDGRGGSTTNGRHALYERELNTDDGRNYNVNSRFSAEFKLLPELTLSTNVSYDTRNDILSSSYNKIIGDGAPEGSSSRTTYQYKTLMFNQLLNYNKSFGNHNLDFLLGHENTTYRSEYVYGSKRGQIVDGIDELINYVTISSLTSYDAQLNKEAYFARANYDFDKKYLLSGSIRQDGSSRFHKDVRWSTFWSLGAGWNIHREAFLNQSKTINKLQLRTSYGEVGNDGSYSSDTSYYAWQPLYSLGWNNSAFAGVMMGSVGNYDLTWETNNQFDVALEFGLFNNRLSGSIEYYKRGTDGLIFSVPKPDSSGNLTRSENIGALENSGIELALNGDVIRTENFRWSLNMNASTLTNKITKLPQEEIINGTKKYQVGSSIYDFWLRQWYGVDPNDGVGLFYASDEAIQNYDEKVASGATISEPELIRTINGEKLTANHNNAKYDYSSSAIPKLFGSFGTSFKYKGFGLSAMFTYQIGGKVYDAVYQSLMTGYTEGAALSTDILRRWQNPGDITDVPRMGSDISYTRAGANSSRWLVDGSFLTLRQVTLSYDLPKEVLGNIGINNLKIFANGENIWSKTARKGLEPGASFSGISSTRFAPSRTISFGFSTNF